VEKATVINSHVRCAASVAVRQQRLLTHALRNPLPRRNRSAVRYFVTFGAHACASARRALLANATHAGVVNGQQRYSLIIFPAVSLAQQSAGNGFANTSAARMR
jgi:hypothetical protein